MNVIDNQPSLSDVVRSRIVHPRAVSVMAAVAHWAGVDDNTAAAAIDNLRSGAVTGILLSGAQASGKDSVCPAVIDAAGIADAVKCPVAFAIRAEMNDIVAAIAASGSPREAVVDVAGAFDVPEEHAAVYVEQFFADSRVTDHGIDAYERTDRMRRALQVHGGEGKAHRPGYWVKKVYQRAVPEMAAGRSVYITDGRFTGEVDAGRSLGLLCVRLWVPEEVRIARIVARDGIEPNLAALRHPGEVALDGYWGLDAEVDNTGTFDATVTAIVAVLNGHRDAMQELPGRH